MLGSHLHLAANVGKYPVLIRNDNNCIIYIAEMIEFSLLAGSYSFMSIANYTLLVGFFASND